VLPQLKPVWWAYPGAVGSVLEVDSVNLRWCGLWQSQPWGDRAEARSLAMEQRPAAPDLPGGLGAGVLLQVIVPWRPPWPAWVGHASGWLLLLAGLSLVAWGVRAAAEVDLERPMSWSSAGPTR
jgi:hypothetical protein